MKACYIAFLLVFVLPSSHSAIYKWIDSNGDTHFSDKFYPGAVEIDLPPDQSFSNPPIVSEEEKSTSQPVDLDSYAVSIIQHQDQETIRSSQGAVAGIVKVE